MSSDPASLDNLRDIVEPAAVSWWPPAIGWWLLLGVILVVAAVFACRALRRWQADAYRRAALVELRSAGSNAEVSVILKRTALAAFPRVDVASLSGQRWCQWLGETSGIQLTDAQRQCLSAGIFADTDRGPDQLKEFASRWIRGHQHPSEDRGGGDDC
jgi:hypothetical protein